jgi:quercetin dioxygenase-like cupin family protein
MVVRKSKHLKTTKVDDPSTKGVKMCLAISDVEGARNFYMRIFNIAKGGYTPLHRHQWEHEVFILKGRGLLLGDGVRYPFKVGDAVFVKENELHQFKNTGKSLLKFICVIPRK